MAKRLKKEYRKLVEEAEHQHWRVEEIEDGLQFYAPDGKTIVTVHGSESDARAMRNTISRMRKAGFRWEGR